MASLVILAAFFVAAISAWAGLGWLFTNVAPARPLAVLAAYVFAFAAIASSGTLVLWLVRRPRSEDGQLKSPAGYLPHSMLLAIILLFGLWLQGLRALTPTAAILLAGLFASIELAVLFGTRGSVELPVRR